MVYNTSMDLFTQLEANDTAGLAHILLGQKLVRTLPDGEELSGRIIEVEAYHESDPAAHTYNGKTQRNAVMFGQAGYAYVYFAYGMHYCLNIVTGKEGEGAAILIRALEPLNGTETMRQNRGLQGNFPKTNLCSGPAKLAQALNIDREFNGHDLNQAPLQLLSGDAVPSEHIITTTRIGIKKAVDVPWRFYIKNNPHVSKP